MIEKNIDYQRVLTFLGHKNTAIPANLEALIKDIMQEVIELSHVKFCHLKTDHSSLPVSHQDVILMGITLGAELDQKIRFYEKTDVPKAIIADAAANALMEEVVSQLEKNFPMYSSLMCPGNQDIPMEWNQIIANSLDTPKRIGLYVTEQYGLIPQKSLIGLMYPVNGQQCKEEKCNRCTLNCKYRKKRYKQ